MTIPTLSFVDRVIFNARNDGTASFVEDGAVKGYQTMEAGGAVNGSQYGYSAQSHDLVSWEVGYGTWTTATKTLTRTVLWNSAGTFVPVSFDQQPQVMITALAESLATFGLGGGAVTQVNTGTGLTGGPVTTIGTISLANTAVTPGPYTNADITIDQQGRITAAANGTGGADPLFLTQGLSVNALDPTINNDANNRTAVVFSATYDKLTSNIGFTGQTTAEFGLNFKAGYNEFGGGGAQGKYTPSVLNVDGIYSGAGEKFVQTWNGQMYSMGDSFLWSGALVYAGGPIAGDEGQGFTPQFFMSQPNTLATETILSVTRTTYSTTVTVDVTGSYIAQDIQVASTAGASVGDWVILNQTPPTGFQQMWAMEIESINPGVSIHGVCAIHAAVGCTIVPALCLVLDNGGFQFGEGRVLVNNSGASYSTGHVANVTGGSFNGSGTTWSNTMVGGDALNVGAVWLAVDDVTSVPFSPNTLRSVYQIIPPVTSTTAIGIFSFSVAGDMSYHGRGVPPASNLSYTIVPAARIFKVNPVSINNAYTVVCEYSAHTWTVGNTVECVICPYPDTHGLDFRMAEYTAGGICRYGLSFINNGAREFDVGIILNIQGGIGGLPDYDAFGWLIGLQIFGAETGIDIQAGASTSPAIHINTTVDAGSVISWQQTSTKIGQNFANLGSDFTLTEGGGLLRAVDKTLDTDTLAPQLLWNGYLQLSDSAASKAYVRFAGSNVAGASIVGTGDWAWNKTLQTFYLITNGASGFPDPWTMFTIGQGSGVAGSDTAAALGISGVEAVSNTTNQPSLPFQLISSVWNGSAAVHRYAGIQAVPASGLNNAPVSLQIQCWDSVNNESFKPLIPMEIFPSGLIKIGSDITATGTDHRVTLDAVTNVSAARTVTFPDTTGDLLVASSNTTGGGSALLGTNSPAVTNTAPYTWLTMLSHDGSTVYVPAWK